LPKTERTDSDDAATVLPGAVAAPRSEEAAGAESTEGAEGGGIGAPRDGPIDGVSARTTPDEGGARRASTAPGGMDGVGLAETGTSVGDRGWPSASDRAAGSRRAEEGS
jgi:hypothetical protein